MTIPSPDIPGERQAPRLPRQQPPPRRWLSGLIRLCLRFFFYLIYQPMAWSYDLVAWTVSGGRWRDWVLCTLPYLDQGPVLELGHGPGHLQAALARGGRLTFGLDSSRQMSRLAQRRLRKLGYAQNITRGNSRAMPFRSRTFNRLVSTFPSEYIFHPATLAEARRLLAPGGQLVVAPFAWITGNRPLDRAARWLFRITGEAPEWMDSWLEPFQEAGFHLLRKDFIELRGSRVLVLVFEVSFNLG